VFRSRSIATKSSITCIDQSLHIHSISNDFEEHTDIHPNCVIADTARCPPNYTALSTPSWSFNHQLMIRNSFYIRAFNLMFDASYDSPRDSLVTKYLWVFQLLHAAVPRILSAVVEARCFPSVQAYQLSFLKVKGLKRTVRFCRAFIFDNARNDRESNVGSIPKYILQWLPCASILRSDGCSRISNGGFTSEST